MSLVQPPSNGVTESEVSPLLLSKVNNGRITEHSAMIWNIPSTQTVYSVISSFEQACGEIVGAGRMNEMREDPTLKCIRISFATPYSLQIALNLSGEFWAGSKLLIKKYKGPNHGKTNSNLLLAQNGFNLNGINNLPNSLHGISMNNKSGIAPSVIAGLVNNGAINAGRGSNKNMIQQIFQHLDMEQSTYLMLVLQHITQNNQFKEQQEREEKEREKRKQREKERKEKEKERDGDSEIDENTNNQKTEDGDKDKDGKSDHDEDAEDDEDDDHHRHKRRRHRRRRRDSYSRSRSRSGSNSRSRKRRDRYRRHYDDDRYYRGGKDDEIDTNDNNKNDRRKKYRDRSRDRDRDNRRDRYYDDSYSSRRWRKKYSSYSRSRSR